MFARLEQNFGPVEVHRLRLPRKWLILYLSCRRHLAELMILNLLTGEGRRPCKFGFIQHALRDSPRHRSETNPWFDRVIRYG